MILLSEQNISAKYETSIGRTYWNECYCFGVTLLPTMCRGTYSVLMIVKCYLVVRDRRSGRKVYDSAQSNLDILQKFRSRRGRWSMMHNKSAAWASLASLGATRLPNGCPTTLLGR